MSPAPPEALNIADVFLTARLREGRGDRVALCLADKTLTYRQVETLASQIAQGLRSLGVRQEERVMIALPDSAEFVAALFATLKIGAVVVMVNPQFTVAEIRALYAYTRARVAIVDPSVADNFSDAMEPGRPHHLVVAGETVGALPALTDLCRGAEDDLECVATHRDDPAIWLFSGGTTGRPKAVVQTHGSFANTTEKYAQGVLSYHESDITLSVPKLFFGYATGSNLFFPFAVGASAVLFPEKPTPEVLFDLIARHRPTILINVPTMIQRMVTHPLAGQQDLSSLRFSTSAGEALPVPLYHRWKEVFGVELLDGLGTAEMWHIFLTNRPGDVRPGTLGRVVPGFAIKVCDEHGQEVEVGEVGRLWVRGDSRALGYWQNAAKTAAAFRGEWFVGGDLVQRDADGYVTYCGRSDDVLKVSGKWLVPQEVESCLMRHPAVEECAVVGVVDCEGLTKPYAFIVAKPLATADDDLANELRAFCLEHLQPYKHPRRVIFLGQFPRTHLGKIDRGQLKKFS